MLCDVHVSMPGSWRSERRVTPQPNLRLGVPGTRAEVEGSLMADLAEGVDIGEAGMVCVRDDSGGRRSGGTDMYWVLIKNACSHCR